MLGNFQIRSTIKQLFVYNVMMMLRAYLFQKLSFFVRENAQSENDLMQLQLQ